MGTEYFSGGVSEPVLNKDGVQGNFVLPRTVPVDSKVRQDGGHSRVSEQDERTTIRPRPPEKMLCPRISFVCGQQVSLFENCGCGRPIAGIAIQEAARKPKRCMTFFCAPGKILERIFSASRIVAFEACTLHASRPNPSKAETPFSRASANQDVTSMSAST